MSTWIELSAKNLRISPAAMRIRLYRGVVPMPKRVCKNRWWVEVIDPPLNP